MPKLKWDDAYDVKRKQIADMKARNIITTDGFISKVDRKEYGKDADPFKWIDADVQDFYENYVSAEAVAEYEAIVEAENSLIEAEKKKDPEYIKKRPLRDAAFQKKIDDLYKENMSQEDREAKIKDFQEELEYAQLRYDKSVNKLTKPEDIARFAELEEKYSIQEYEQMNVRTSRVEKYLDKVNKKLEKMGTPKAPGLLTRMWNRIQRITSGEDLKSVRDYDEYSRLTDRQRTLEHSLTAAKAVQEAFMEEHPNFDYQSITKKVEVSPLELAKHIVKMSMSKKSVALSNAEITNEAEVVMKTKEFEKVQAEFGDKLKYVEPNVFYKRFMTELAPKLPTAEEVERSNNILAKQNKELEEQSFARRM